jgi:hypothetical protein
MVAHAVRFFVTEARKGSDTVVEFNRGLESN